MKMARLWGWGVAVAAAACALPLGAGTFTFGGSGYDRETLHDWAVPETWVEAAKSDGAGEDAVPQRGDKVSVLNNYSLKIGAGTAVDGVELSAGVNLSQGGGRIVVDGGEITDSPITLGGGQSSCETTFAALELRSGTIANPAQALTVKRNSRLNISGGEMTQQKIIWGTDFGFDISGGKFTLLGEQNANSQTVNGFLRCDANGAYNFTGGEIVLGNPQLSFGTGRARVTIDGTKMPENMTYTVPQDIGGDAKLVLRNMTNTANTLKFQLTSGGQNRHDYTGEVCMVNCKLSGALELGKNNLASWKNCMGRLVMDNTHWHSSVGLYITPGASKIDSHIYWTITNRSQVFVAANADPALVASGASMGIQLGDGAHLDIADASLYINDRLYLNEGGDLSIGEGGYVELRRAFSRKGSEPFRLRMRGGEIKPRDGTLMLGGDGNSFINSWASCPVDFAMSGGKISASRLLLNNGSTNHVVRFEYSGGELGSGVSVMIGNLNHKPGSEAASSSDSYNPHYPEIFPRAEIAIRGARGTPQIKSLTVNAMNGTFLNERILDISPGHIAPLEFAGEPALGGHLRIRLDGGVLLSGARRFAVTRSAHATRQFAEDAAYDSLPSGSLWTIGMSEDRKESYAEIAEAALVPLNPQMAATLATPAAQGAVRLPQLKAEIVKEYAVLLKLQPQGETTLDGIVAAFNRAGYIGSRVESAAERTVKVVIPNAALPERNAERAQYFIWDFTRCPGVKAVDETIVDALVESVALKANVINGMMIIVR